MRECKFAYRFKMELLIDFLPSLRVSGNFYGRSGLT